MSTATNTALNSRSMAGIIQISDGVATLENGDLNCDDINSSTLNTNTLTTASLTCNGIFRCNINGPYTIPTSISSLTGLLVSYGNTSNSGSTDLTNYQASYTSTQGGFRLNNISSTQTLTNLAIIDNTQTYFKSQLVGCLAESPVNPTSVANKTYVDTNFVYKTGSVTENITGAKTFTDDITALNIYCNTALYFRDINLGLNKALMLHQADIVYFDTLTVYDNYWKFKCFNIEQVVISQLSATFNNKLISLAQARFDNFTPICTVASPTQINHLTRKDYCDSNFMFKTGSIAESINGVKTFSNNTIFTGLATFNGGAVFNTTIPTTSISASSANELVNYTTLTGQGFTTLALVQSNANTFSATNTFSNTINANGQVNIKNNLLVYDLISPFTKYTRISQSGNDTTFKHFLGTSTSFIFETLNATPSAVQSLLLSSTQVSVPINLSVTGTSNFTGNITSTGSSNLNGQVNVKNNLLLYDITPSLKYTRISQSGNDTTFKHFDGTSTSFIFETLNAAPSAVQSLILSSTTATVPINLSVSGNTTMSGTASISSDLTLRATKLYNKVQLITATPTTLTFPLEENILIRPTGAFGVVLPLLNSTTQMGMTFNFVTNHATHLITIAVSSGSSNTIIRNGNVTGVSSAVLLGDGITSVNLTCIEYNSGVYSWVVLNSSLPQQISNPVGSIITMSVNSLPAGYLFCNGANISGGTIYANLFAVIGTTYGNTGGIPGNFNVPNFNNGSFLRGFGGNSAAIGTQQADNIKTHTHDIKFGFLTTTGTGGGGNAYNSTAPNYNNPNSGAGRATGFTELNTAGSPDETRPVNYAVYYCIKY